MPARAPHASVELVSSPGSSIVISPSQSQMHIEPVHSAGNPSIRTVGAPGNQGEVVTGTHGIGVSTPKAAAVAAATSGLAMLVHRTKEGMFSSGMKSMMVAAGNVSSNTGNSGGTIIGIGAVPKLQESTAPKLTSCGNAFSLARYSRAAIHREGRPGCPGRPKLQLNPPSGTGSFAFMGKKLEP